MRAGRHERRDLVVGQPALGADHHHDPAGRRHVERGQRRRRRPRAARRPGRRRRPARRRRRSSPARRPRGTTTRRACLAASRAVERQRASDFAARSPFQTATLRAAAHGTIRATPTSVSTSTASSPRSPFGIAWTTVDRRARRAARRRRRRDRHRERPACRSTATAPVTDRPRPSVSTTASPTRSRRTATAWCASSPVDLDRRARPRRRRATGTRWTGRDIGGSVLVEGVAEPAEHAACCSARTWPVGFSSPRIAASSRSSSSWRGSSRVGVSTSDRDDQVAATAAQPGHAAAAQHLLEPDWVPGLTSSSKEVSTPGSSDSSASTRSASSVGSVSVVPERGRGHRHARPWQCRSLPCRVNVGCGATWIST